MKGPVERFAWRMWRDEAGWPGRLVGILLLPLEGVWRLATRARNGRWDRSGGARVPGLTVVSVGNLAVGGTGKTPVSGWVAATLDEWDARPALLLRGYGEDEVRLHRRWNPGVPVVVGTSRVEAARRARGEGAETAVLDDGFQHRRLHRSVDVVLLAAEDPVPGSVLPRGPYREPWSALRRADVVIVTRRSGSADAARGMVARLQREGILPETVVTAGLHLAANGTVGLEDFVADDSTASGRSALPTDGGEAEGPRNAAPEAATPGALVVTAIARPEAFRRDVETLTGMATELETYPDHHVFDEADARRIRRRAAGRSVYVTEKDAVKLAEHRDLLPRVRVVVQRLLWDWGEDEVRRRLRSSVRSGEEAS